MKFAIQAGKLLLVAAISTLLHRKSYGAFNRIRESSTGLQILEEAIRLMPVLPGISW
jgi:hypothetical protein